jgi:hypothetical protein
VKAVPMINDFTSRFMVFIQKKGLQTLRAWGGIICISRS